MLHICRLWDRFVYSSTNLHLSQIDCDKTIMVSLKHDDKLQEGSECAFQVLLHVSSAMPFTGILYLLPCCMKNIYFIYPGKQDFWRDFLFLILFVIIVIWSLCVIMLSSVPFFTPPYMDKEESEFQHCLCLAPTCWVICSALLILTPNLLVSWSKVLCYYDFLGHAIEIVVCR